MLSAGAGHWAGQAGGRVQGEGRGGSKWSWQDQVCQGRPCAGRAVAVGGLLVPCEQSRM